jgi:O-antigen/teichoic acid export membrane protein
MASKPARAPALMLTGNTLLRLVSVGLRALLTLAMAVWLQPAELVAYALIGATLTLTTYFYGLDFQTFSMRELSSRDLAGARLRVRDQFAMLLVIYALGSAVLTVVLTRLGLDSRLLALIVPMAVLQHAGLEIYRILNRLGRPVAGTVVLLIRDAAWAPACIAVKLATGELSLARILAFWLAGSAASVLFGGWLLARWLPPSERRPVDLAWLASGLRSGFRMLIATLSVAALLTLDRMIFARLTSPDQLGAYALFALGCASVHGLFETAILPSFWAPLLQAKNDDDEIAYRRAERALTRVCLIAAAVVGMINLAVLTVLAWLLPHRAYEDNIHLLYYLAAAYSLLIVANIPHYRLFAARRDRWIVAANVAVLAIFLGSIALFAAFDRALAVPNALVLACALLIGIKSVMVHRLRLAVV